MGTQGIPERKCETVKIEQEKDEVADSMVVRLRQRPVTVFVVGRVKGGGFPDVIWDLVGVFSSPERAVAACTAHNDAVMPMVLDEKAPEEATPHPNCCFPLAIEP